MTKAAANKATAGTAPAAIAENQTAAPATGATAPEGGTTSGDTGGDTGGDSGGELDPQPQPQGPSVAVRSVAARGRWRIGRFFTPEPQLIPVADLSDEEKERLASDPELVCQLVDAD